MSNLNDEYEKIISKIESNITNEKDFQLVKNEIAKLTILFINTIDKVIEYSNEKLINMEEKHQDLEERLNILQNKMNKMEKDIYEDEDEFEFEVVCPYCNHQFVTDVDLELNSEIKCPECKNIIELDWNEDSNEEESCRENCKGCEGCKKNEKEDFSNLQELNEIEINIEDKDDDM